MLEARPIITLTTDFGLRDTYVGQMKGVLLSRVPLAAIVDLTHQIPPQDVVAAAFQIDDAARAFPPGAVHVVVVDPGVGTSRSILAIRARDQLFVGPDNGVFTRIIESEGPVEVVAVDLDQIDPHRRSHTFHGRDLMSPVAAELASGRQLFELGTTFEPILLPETRDVGLSSERLAEGRIIWVDHFGNLISNVVAGDAAPTGFEVVIEGATLPIRNCYGAVESGSLLALVGSSDRVEVAVNGGSAAERLGLSNGAQITVAQSNQEP